LWQWLTGGTLLSRDMEFIVFYRGKDFLPAAVSSAITERRRSPTMHGDNLKIAHSISGLDKSPKELEGDTGNNTDPDGSDTPTNQRIYIPENRKQWLIEAAMKKTSEKLAVVCFLSYNNLISESVFQKSHNWVCILFHRLAHLTDYRQESNGREESSRA